LIKKGHLQVFEWKNEDLVEFVSKVLTVAQLKSWLHFVIFSKSTSSSSYPSPSPSLPTRAIPIDIDLKRRCKGAKTKKDLLDLVSFLFTSSFSSSYSSPATLRSSSASSSSSSSALQLRFVEVAKEMFGVFVKISDSDRKFFNMVHRIFFLSSSGGGLGDGTTTSTSSLMILVDMDRIRFPLYPIKTLWDGEGVDDFLRDEEGESQSQVETLHPLHSQQDLPLGRRKDRQWDQERWLRRKKEQQNRLEAVLGSKPVFSSRESFDKYEESLELARAMLLALQGTVGEDSIVVEEEEERLSQGFQDEFGRRDGEIGAGNDELALQILEEAATQMALEVAKLNRTIKSEKAEDANEDSNTSQFLLRFTMVILFTPLPSFSYFLCPLSSSSSSPSSFLIFFRFLSPHSPLLFLSKGLYLCFYCRDWYFTSRIQESL
jgi:hypothetical protein